MSQSTLDAVERLAIRMGVRADQIFSIVEQQAKVEAFGKVLWMIMEGLAVYICYSILSWAMPFWFTRAALPGGTMVIVILSSMGSIVVGILAVTGIVEDINEITTMLLNPKYWAIKEIFGNIK